MVGPLSAYHPQPSSLQQDFPSNRIRHFPRRSSAVRVALITLFNMLLIFETQALDAALRGGVPFGGVTELVGPAGVGKSQWCLALTLRAALPQGEACSSRGTGLTHDTSDDLATF